MEKFGDALGEYLNSLGLSQTKAADALDVSRAMLYSVLKNEKRLSEDNFRKLMSAIPFSDAQKRALRKLYYRDAYPAGTIDKIYCIMDHLSKGDEGFVLDDVPVSASLPERTKYVSGETEILSLIKSVILDENQKNIYTNYPFLKRKIDSAVFNALKRAPKKEKFVHFVEFEDDDKTTLNIDNLFSAEKYVKMGYIPLWFYSGAYADEPLQMYPFFFLSDDFLFMFSAKYSSGPVIVEKDIISGAVEKVERFALDCGELGKVCENIFDFRDAVIFYGGYSPIASISKRICAIGRSDPAVINDIIKDDIRGREQIVKMGIDHYSALLKTDFSIYTTKEGIKSFIKDGYATEIPRELLKPMPYSRRIEVLKRFSDMYETAEVESLIMDDDILNYGDDYTSVELFTDIVMLAGSVDDGDKSFSGQYFVIMKDGRILSDFLSYIDFIKRNRLYVKKQVACEFLKQQIYECEMRLQDESGGGGAVRKVANAR